MIWLVTSYQVNSQSTLTKEYDKKASQANLYVPYYNIH